MTLDLAMDSYIQHQKNQHQNKVDFIKLKPFCSKDTIGREKGQTTEWKKTFINHMLGKSSIQNILRILTTQQQNKK